MNVKKQVTVALNFNGACGGSPPSVFRRDSSKRFRRPRWETGSSASNLSPRGTPVSPKPASSSTAYSHLTLIWMRVVSSLRRCPGSPPTPRGATRLPPGGGTSSGAPRGPPRRSPQIISIELLISTFPALQFSTERYFLKLACRCEI